MENPEFLNYEGVLTLKKGKDGIIKEWHIRWHIARIYLLTFFFVSYHVYIIKFNPGSFSTFSFLEQLLMDEITVRLIKALTVFTHSKAIFRTGCHRG